MSDVLERILMNSWWTNHTTTKSKQLKSSPLLYIEYYQKASCKAAAFFHLTFCSLLVIWLICRTRKVFAAVLFTTSSIVQPFALATTLHISTMSASILKVEHWSVCESVKLQYNWNFYFKKKSVIRNTLDYVHCLWWFISHVDAPRESKINTISILWNLQKRCHHIHRSTYHNISNKSQSETVRLLKEWRMTTGGQFFNFLKKSNMGPCALTQCTETGLFSSNAIWIYTWI